MVHFQLLLKFCWRFKAWLQLVNTMSGPADRRQMCIELLLASADTSSVTLYYTLVLLAQKPELKEALIEEIQAVKVGPFGKPKFADYELMNRKNIGQREGQVSETSGITSREDD